MGLLAIFMLPALKLASYQISINRSRKQDGAHVLLVNITMDKGFIFAPSTEYPNLGRFLCSPAIHLDSCIAMAILWITVNARTINNATQSVTLNNSLFRNSNWPPI
jgi:hypothetical protein